MNNPPGLDPPLADYFWIAGIDSISYGEHLAQDLKPARRSFTEQLLEAIEAEEEVQENLLSPRNGTFSNLMPLPDNNFSTNFSSDLLGPNVENVESVGNAENGDCGDATSQATTPGNLIRNSSNSSSSTITNNNNVGNPEGKVRRFKGMNDDDFDNALLKFAAERDSFLDDLSFSAGTIMPHKPVMHPRAQRVVSEDLALQKAPSLRRRISLRDLTSMRRAPSVNRACKDRNSLVWRWDSHWFANNGISTSYSIYTYGKAYVQLQLGHTNTTTPQFIP